MSRIYLVRSAALTNYAELARSVELDPFRMLARAGLPRDSLSNPDLRLSVTAVYRLLEASAAESGVESFGLRLADTRDLSNFGPLGLAMKEELTVRTALETLIRYFTIHNEAMLLRKEESNDVVVMTVQLLGDRPAHRPQAEQLSVGVFYRIVHALIRPAASGLVACLRQPRPRADADGRGLMDGRVQFGQAIDGIVFKARDLDRPMPSSDRVLAGYARQYLDSLVAAPRRSMSDQVRALLTVLLPSGRCSVDRIAGQLGVDRRTIHRRLASEGRTFMDILNEVRREIAQSQMRSETQPLTDLASMLGFSSLSSFSRWFSHSFGCSGRDWRSGHADALLVDK